ncbi:MAG: hypothetical protein ACK55Z_18980 [bacterium]
MGAVAPCFETLATLCIADTTRDITTRDTALSYCSSLLILRFIQASGRCRTMFGTVTWAAC